MHLILRQLLSWELYCYPILLIHFESLDTSLLPHRLFFKRFFWRAQMLPVVVSNSRVVLFFSHSLSLYICIITYNLGCLEWNSRKAVNLDVTSSGFTQLRSQLQVCIHVLFVKCSLIHEHQQHPCRCCLVVYC